MNESMRGFEGDLDILDDLIEAKTGQRELEMGETNPTADQISDFVKSEIVPKLKRMSEDERAQAERDIGEILESAGIGFKFND